MFVLEYFYSNLLKKTLKGITKNFTNLINSIQLNNYLLSVS